MRWFVLNVEANVEIDITAADGLRELARELADRGIHLGLARVKNDLYEPLDRAGVIDVDRQRDALRHPAGRRGELPALGPGSRAGAAHGNARASDRRRTRRQPAALAAARLGRRAGRRARPRPRPLTTVLVAASPSFIGGILLRSAAMRSRETIKVSIRCHG